MAKPYLSGHYDGFSDVRGHSDGIPYHSNGIPDKRGIFMRSPNLMPNLLFTVMLM